MNCCGERFIGRAITHFSLAADPTSSAFTKPTLYVAMGHNVNRRPVLAHSGHWSLGSQHLLLTWSRLGATAWWELVCGRI